MLSQCLESNKLWCQTLASHINIYVVPMFGTKYIMVSNIGTSYISICGIDVGIAKYIDGIEHYNIVYIHILYQCLVSYISICDAKSLNGQIWYQTLASHMNIYEVPMFGTK